MKTVEIIKAANKLKIDTVVKNLEKRRFQAYYCETKEEANALILSMIHDKSIVAWGGSVTINSLGIKEKLTERNVKIIDPFSTREPVEALELRRQSLMSDYFLMSANAITMNGELVNIDANGNRVAALCFGPKKIIIVTGANKLARGLDDALERAKLYAAVPNNVRLARKTPCTTTGNCSDCLADDCICCNIVTTRFCYIPGRIHVILVNENIGF